jgi:hypothetical protein
VQQQPSRAKVPVWLLLVATIGAGAAIWALAPTSKQQTTDSDSEETSAASGTAPAGHAVADLSRLRQAMEVLSRAHADPATPDRKAALNDLLSQPDAPAKLTLLLEAAAADPTAPDKDPLWPDLVQGLSTIWQGETINSGIDLMHIESRPRARDAVVSSFAKVALERTGDLSPPQTQKLTETFIDLHDKLPAYQQREVERAARKIAGNDVADLMQGKTGEELEYHREYQKSIAENQQRVASQ